MKKSVAMKWVAALESGDYKQGKGELRNGLNQFCCLGVLCNLHAQDKPKLAKSQQDTNMYFGESGFLPEIVQEWSGMKTNNGVHVIGKDEDGWEEHDQLTSMNDGGMSFRDIAKVIRQRYKEL